MPARSDSESDPCEPRKKSKKEKKDKKKEQVKEKAKEKVKEKKQKKAKDSSSSDDGRREKRRKDDSGPTMKASGLLDEEDDPLPPPSRSRNEQQPSRPVADRREPSRSRDDGTRPGGGGGFGERGEDKGKGKGKDKGKDLFKGGEQQPKEEVNFEASGLLAMEDNSKNGILLKFTVPAEARRPSIKWRLYCFIKGQDDPKQYDIHRQVGYLFGKDRRVADIPTDHATCSKQHAVLHFRQTPKGEVKPYIMDLESINGTFVNGERIETARYLELKEKDVLKFGMSSREFVLLNKGSANHIKIDPKDLRSPSEG
eukprot:TRINITY_DN25339_c0_g2_i1.p1 TRINITY_DN25339_c0_g2~~TRINITY_DN25339_c0_g2_i1.p1  ORF type:complete len:312 (+),score=91.45 TRINITY_DN25339_c0_g2_i1:55-990(+)